jgi:hypothetical protein
MLLPLRREMSLPMPNTDSARGIGSINKTPSNNRFNVADGNDRSIISIRKINSRDQTKNLLFQNKSNLPRDKATYEAVKLQMRNKKMGGNSLSDIKKTKNILKERDIQYHNNDETFEIDSDNNSDNETVLQRTPSEELFLYAVTRGHVDDAEKLLNLGVNVNVCNDFKRDATQIAARNGNVSMLKLLHENGANFLTNRGVHGDTLFHLAASNGHVHALKYLHSVGAPPDWKDEKGQTPVHSAARRCELQVLKYFHQSLNLDLATCDHNGVKPVDLVPRFGYDHAEETKEYILRVSNEMVAHIIATGKANKQKGVLSPL